MKIKCAIFDFDGTLFDSMKIWDTTGEKYLRSVGREPKPSMKNDVKTMSLYEAAKFYKTDYSLSLSAEEIMTGITRIVEDYYFYEIMPKPHVKKLLDEMKEERIHICIATANDRGLIEPALKRCDMEKYFDAVFSCTEIGCGKEDPLIFRRAMEHFGADRTNTVVFEDAFHAAQTAKSDGFKVVAVYDPSEKEQDELKKISDCYLFDFENTDIFRKYVSAL